MYYGNTIDGLFTFIIETDKHIKRIHLTHTDMDGVGCSVVMECADRIFNTGIESESPITTIYCSNPSKANNMIRETAETVLSQGFNKETDLLEFLVTDLGNIDPGVFKEINDSGLPCVYIVVDHHQSKINNFDTVDNVTTKDGRIVRKAGYYFTGIGLCATYLLYDMVSSIFNSQAAVNRTSNMDQIRIFQSELSKSYFINNPLKGFAETVNLYDTGKWGQWNIDDYTKIAPEVMMQLIYLTYSMDHKYEEAKHDILTVMCNGEGADNLRHEWGTIVKNSHAELINEYKACMRKMNEVSDSNIYAFFGTVTVYIPFKAKYFEVYKNYELKYFSLVSKEILESEDIDVLALINYARNVVELRSAGNRFDCGKLARRNGGGGHFNAAGFPFKELPKMRNI